MQPIPEPGDITLLLARWKEGDEEAATKLIGFVYDDLRRLAGAYMRRERPDHTLQPTALVHEAFLRLIGEQAVDWRNRAHFLALAATVMRRVLVEYARRRNAAKRGGLEQKIELSEATQGSLDAQAVDVIDIDAALNRLAEFDPRLTRVVELRYFGGLSVDEVSEVIGVSPRTIKRDWTIAKAWLREEMQR